MNKITRIGIYIRVSTDEQAKHGYSIESQKNRLISWSKEKNYRIVDTYIDEGKSARTKISNRKELLRLLDDVQNDKIDRIIIWRLDRWFRNVADYYKIQEILDKHNVDWECSDEDFNTSTSNGRLYLNIKLSIAQNESDQTSDRIKFNFENMVRNKRPISGALPIGYKIEGEKQNKRVVIDEELKPMALDMFRIFEETLSIKATTKYLHDNYPQRPIKYERVKRMLKNSMYHGEYRDVIDYCPTLIDRNRHNQIIDNIKKNQRIIVKSSHIFIFSGLVKCYCCGRRMAGSRVLRKNKKSTVQYGTYKCTKCFLDTYCDNHHTLNENNLEQWLIENCLNKLNNYIVEVKKIEELQNKSNPHIKIKNLKLKLDRLNDLYIDGRITKEKYDNNYFDLQEKIKSIKIDDTPIDLKRLEDYQNKLNKTNVFDLYNKLSRPNKKLFWYEFIEHIEQDPSNIYENWKIFFK